MPWVLRPTGVSGGGSPCTYNVAVIGAGKWSENHLAGWRAQSDANVTWVVRSSEERAKQEATAWGVPNWSATYQEVVRREDVDIVDILLPHDLTPRRRAWRFPTGST